jgi:hypothetical protein
MVVNATFVKVTFILSVITEELLPRELTLFHTSDMGIESEILRH